MNKLFFSMAVFLFLSVAAIAQTKPVNAADTKQLPDCVLIRYGKLQAKAGYTVTVSKDGKTFTVGNAKGIGGTFNCSCSANTTGNCSATVNGGIILCSGSCVCTIAVVISGITYTVDLTAGLLRKN